LLLNILQLRESFFECTREAAVIHLELFFHHWRDCIVRGNNFKGSGLATLTACFNQGRMERRRRQWRTEEEERGWRPRSGFSTRR
ncbi:hypothetical protein LINPERHAP2_LOCUS41756, partial [Linum perenne]